MSRMIYLSLWFDSLSYSFTLFHSRLPRKTPRRLWLKHSIIQYSGRSKLYAKENLIYYVLHGDREAIEEYQMYPFPYYLMPTRNHDLEFHDRLDMVLSSPIELPQVLQQEQQFLRSRQSMFLPPMNTVFSNPKLLNDENGIRDFHCKQRTYVYCCYKKRFISTKLL